MKKIFVSVVLGLVLTGCFGSSTVVEENSSENQPADEQKVAAASLIEKDFVAISAEILCLPTNNPSATSVEIEAKAKKILLGHNINEVDFNDYQVKATKDETEKTRLSYAIVGKMNDFCQIVPGQETGVPSAVAPSTNANATGAIQNQAGITPTPEQARTTPSSDGASREAPATESAAAPATTKR